MNLQLTILQYMNFVRQDKFYSIYLELTKEMVQVWHLRQELLKLTAKISKFSYAWMAWCRQKSEGINYIVMKV